MSVASWVDRSIFPFEPRWFEYDRRLMHYVDEGRGEPVVFVHGSPTWSFMYRDVIKGLKGSFRCIAMDNLGFGLSEKPSGLTYRPERQAEILEAFIKHLGLKNVTLVVHEFGGPIGLSYALKHPENMRHLVMLNTFLWPLRGNATAERVHRLAGTALGNFVFLNLNWPVRGIMRAWLKDRAGFKPRIREHYARPFDTRAHRQAPLHYARAYLGSSDWLQSLWNQNDVLAGIPTLVIWGMMDPLLGAEALERWEIVAKEAEIHRLPHTGHFVAEEHGADIVPFLDTFLKDTSFLPTATVDL